MSSTTVQRTASSGAGVPLLFAYPATMLSFAKWLMPEVRKNPPAIIRESKEGPMYNQNIINIAFLIGRIIAGGFFLTSGINHLAKLNMVAGYATSKGTPAPELAVGGTGALLILGGASLLLGDHPTIGATLLIICLLGF